MILFLDGQLYNTFYAPILYSIKVKHKKSSKCVHSDKVNDVTINHKGSLQKKTPYFITSGKKVGGPKTKTKFQKRS